LWRLAWALWEIKEYRGARQAWTELSLLSIDSEYVPASLYWSARAADLLGEVESAGSSYRALDSVFTNSYYSVIRRRDPNPDSTFDPPLLPPALDDLSVSSEAHTRKFGMLATMQLSDLALREWPAAQCEQPESPGFAWWKVQMQYWDGHRLDAWNTMRNELGQFVRTDGRRPDDFYRIAYPRDFSDSVARISAEYKVDLYLVMGVICQESHFEQNIVSGAGAIGLMQLLPSTASLQARTLGLPYSINRLDTPGYNLQLGIAHLAELLNEWKGDTVLALASYNAGRNVAASWQTKFGNCPRDEFIEKIPYRETRLFVKRITEHIAAYRRLYPDLAGQS
jgi:soluble lytic murein transglycosylase